MNARTVRPFVIALLVAATIAGVVGLFTNPGATIATVLAVAILAAVKWVFW